MMVAVHNMSLQNMSNNSDLYPVAIPNFQTLLAPVLRLTSDQQEHPLAQIRSQVARELNLTEEALAERLARSSQTVFANRIAWAVQYLKAAQALEPVRRSVYKITQRGLSLREANPSGITAQTLRQFPEFREFQGRGDAESRTEATSPTPEESVDTPEESLDRSFQIQRDALASDLLEAVHNGSPAAFEKLVVDLLLAMGYGMPAKESGRIVGGPGDGGIDGIIQQDKLGLEEIYLQAKRWKDNVGSPEIMKFSGALTKKNAHHGVFITSSGFTADAIEHVRGLSQKIVLIDGKRLASLMIDHNVGVTPDKTFQLKRLDPTYFENL
jgi:restriction system protein